jgi:hypothetical protein
MDALVWMCHRDSGGVAQMAASAVEGFELLGWERCDAPEEPNPVLAQHEAPARAEPEEPEGAEPDDDDDEPASAGPDDETEE